MNVFLIGGLGNNIFQVLGTKHITGVKYIDTLQDTNFITRILGWTIHEKQINGLLKIKTQPVGKLGLIVSVVKFFISQLFGVQFVGYKYCPSFEVISDGQVKAVTGYLHPLTQIDYETMVQNVPKLMYEKKRQIGVHIRRGDIGKSKRLGLLERDSLNNIIDMVATKYKLPIVVYTNDRRWCENNLDCKFSFANYELDSDPVINDFLGLCGSEILICSNSTFSYTAALLGEHEQIFVPEPFFNDEPIFIPSSWQPYSAKYL